MVCAGAAMNAFGRNGSCTSRSLLGTDWKQAGPQVARVAFEHAEHSERADDVVQCLVAAAEQPVFHRGAVVLKVDPAWDDQRRRHDELERGEARILPPT